MFKSPHDQEASQVLPVFPEGESIPKLIHQVFFGAREFSDELKANLEKIKALNPTWKHTLYDDVMMKDFIAEHYGQKVLDYFNRINPNYGAARVDFFRYLLLYKMGGAYLDIKSTLNRPFDEFIRPDDRYILGQWDDPNRTDRVGWGMHNELSHVARGEFQQWHVICAPGHPFLRAVILSVMANIDHYVPWRVGTGAHGTFKVTGPIAYTLAIDPLRGQYEHRVIDTVDAGLEYSIFSHRSHSTIFTTHYFGLSEPVVSIGPALRALWTARKASRKIKGGLRRLLKPFRQSAPAPGR